MEFKHRAFLMLMIVSVNAYSAEEKRPGATIIRLYQNPLLIRAIKDGNLQEVVNWTTRESVKKDIDCLYKDGKTALWYGVAYGHEDIVKYLVKQCNSCLEKSTFDGESIIDTARKMVGREKIADWLERYSKSDKQPDDELLTFPDSPLTKGSPSLADQSPLSVSSIESDEG